MSKLTIKLFVLIIVISLFGCTNYLLTRADKAYDKLQYQSAIKDYNKVIAKEGNHEAAIKLANCYRLVNDVDKAEVQYEKVMAYTETKPIDQFHYARILMSKEKYPQAGMWFEKYLESFPDDIVAQMLLASCKSVNTFKEDTTLYILNKIEFEEFESAFSSVPHKDGIVFVAESAVSLEAKQSPWTGQSYLDLYFAEKDKEGHWLSPQLLKGKVNGRYHEGPAAFNKEGNIVYFTRSNYYKVKLKQSSKGENNLKLFSAKLVGDEWKELEELPFNSDEYSVGHPCLADDQKTLYFISDKPGGFGGTDIYKSTLENDKWSEPVNLGKSVNTSGYEMFPFIDDDGTFYFSSTAHNNMGGLDVFATSYDSSEKRWLQVENLNYPLNSSKDDFAFVMNDDKRSGFVSSNRTETDAIYSFKKHDPTFRLLGVVKIKGKDLPFEGATITLVDITDPKNPMETTTLTNKDGSYLMKLKPNSDYKVYGSHENYFTQSVKLSTKGLKTSKDFTANFELEQIVIEKPIVLENIYYDLDKWNIRPDAAVELDKLVTLLNDNPNIVIEMGSHTDSRAGDRYNLVLSDKRAKAAVDYLVFKGIDASRLEYKGYGETKLVNQCKNNVECTEDEHQQNRRTEFKVIKIEKDSESL